LKKLIKSSEYVNEDKEDNVNASSQN